MWHHALMSWAAPEVIAYSPCFNQGRVCPVMNRRLKAHTFFGPLTCQEVSAHDGLHLAMCMMQARRKALEVPKVP